MGEVLYSRCKRCNRPLKSVEARQRGYGNLCWQKHQNERTKKAILFKLVELCEIK